MDNEIQNLKKRILEWDIIPVPKPRMTQRDKWLKPPRTPVQNYWNYKDVLKGFSLRDKYVVSNPLSLIFVLPMPISWSNKKCERMVTQPHTQKPDLDNLIKAFKDALCIDDSHIYAYDHIRKVWGYEGKILIVDYTND